MEHPDNISLGDLIDKAKEVSGVMRKFTDVCQSAP